jgi:hypothetical protein
MPGAQHQFEFVGKEPLALWVVLSLLFANTLLMLWPESSGAYIFGQHSHKVARWYTDHSIAIQFVLLALLGAVVVIYRKQIRYIRRT